MKRVDIQKLLSKYFKKAYTRGFIIGLISSIALAGVVVVLIPDINHYINVILPMNGIIPSSAATFNITHPVKTSFATYTPETIEYNPSIKPITINSGLSNVNFQDLNPPSEAIPFLEKYGFALVDEGVTNFSYYYTNSDAPKFITTDLCLHAFHIMFDMSLRILEGTHFYDDLMTLLNGLRNAQLQLYDSTSNTILQDALSKNIAYLTVMMVLLDNSTTIPNLVKDLVTSELSLIEAGVPANSVIFGYKEDWSQYKPRGHYTRNDILANYFKAMMYAGRMSFLLKSMDENDPDMGIRHTRMALLLVQSFNTTISYDKTVWDYWYSIYNPTVFYVGKSDDLTPMEYYQIWKEVGQPSIEELADDTVIQDFIEIASTYRPPQINSMFVYDTNDYQNVTHGFRLMGQRFIPDSYIFQQLVHNKVLNRLMPTGLDVMSVFGSARAAYFLENESKIYPDYDIQVAKLRKWFANLTEYDWTQNLYWLWLYSLFPLFRSPTEGYPFFMLNNAWLDKSLMTALSSWAELRHDTILYAKQSYTLEKGVSELLKGYVEPYPELYLRLKALTLMTLDGLDKHGLLSEDFAFRLQGLATIFGKLAEISVKELENTGLSEADYNFIDYVGMEILAYTDFGSEEYSNWTDGADKRVAMVADVHTDPNTGKVLEVATGNPYTIYVVVQHGNQLYLTRGATFSYYEFQYPLTERLTDEEWQTMLDTNPPSLPSWQTYTLPIVSSSQNHYNKMYVMTREKE